MVPIISGKDGNFDGQTIKDHILEIARQHRAEGRALAFAFLVYDFGDHTMNKILQDTNYWASLDKISGHFLSIFYLNTLDSYYKERNEQIYSEQQRRQARAARGGLLSYMVPVEMELTPLEKGIVNLRSILNIDERTKQPFILFFQTDGEDITDYFLIELKQERLEDAFLELKNYIKGAVKSISKVKPENALNYREIFELVKEGTKGSKFLDFYDRKIKPEINLGNIITLIQILAGIKLQ